MNLIKKKSMYVCFIFTFSLIGCHKKNYFEIQNKIPQSDKIESAIWYSKDSLCSLNTVSCKPVFATDVPGSWLAFIKGKRAKI